MYTDDMWTVYVLRNSQTKELYIGLTGDIARRLTEHNSGGQEATKRLSGQWELVYHESYRDKRDALLREQRLKHHGRAKQELYKRIQISLEAESGAGRSK